MKSEWKELFQESLESGEVLSVEFKKYQDGKERVRRYHGTVMSPPTDKHVALKGDTKGHRIISLVSILSVTKAKHSASPGEG